MFDLYLLTFNCARELVNPTTLAPSLFSALPSDRVPDLLAISLQEISPIAYSFLGGSYLTPYLDRITETVQLAAKLRSNGTQTLEYIATRSLGMTALMIFATPEFSERIRWIQSAGAGCGVWNMGNKGAVATRLGVASEDRNGDEEEVQRLTFVAAHLAPMEKNVQARNNDWEALVRNLVFVNEEASSGYTASETTPLLAERADGAEVEAPEDGQGLFTMGGNGALFVAGDLNYRTRDTKPDSEAYRSYPSMEAQESEPRHYSRLLEDDQLTRERGANRTLHHLRELPINFPPTYKLNVKTPDQSEGGTTGGPEWEWAKHRYPSWCDRILFTDPSKSSRFRLEPLVYTALPVQATSDHRPVALSFRVDHESVKGSRTSKRSGEEEVKPPFPINPHWRTRRDTARRLEVLVGITSYLVLTKKGNAMLVAFVGTVVAAWWMGMWMRR